MNESPLTKYKNFADEILRPIIKEGKFPILISAPHHVCQIKKGEHKESDDFTGDIAAILSSLLDCHLIVNICGTCDPNSDSEDESTYKKITREYIKKHNIRLFIDIHGMADEDKNGNKRPDLCIGTGKGKNISEKSKSVLDGYKWGRDFKCKRDSPFAALGKNTMSRYIHDKCGIDSLQIEIAYRNRKLSDKFVSLIEILKGLIDTLYSAQI